MDIRITCSNLTAGMFQTGVFEEFHSVVWCCRPNRILKSAHSNPFFVFHGQIFSCLCSKSSKPSEASPQGQLPRALLDPPSLPEPSSITLTVSRRGQGRWLGVQRLGVYTGGVLPHALKHRVCEADRGFTLAARCQRKFCKLEPVFRSQHKRMRHWHNHRGRGRTENTVGTLWFSASLCCLTGGFLLSLVFVHVG